MLILICTLGKPYLYFGYAHNITSLLKMFEHEHNKSDYLFNRSSLLKFVSNSMPYLVVPPGPTTLHEQW